MSARLCAAACTAERPCSSTGVLCSGRAGTASMQPCQLRRMPCLAAPLARHSRRSDSISTMAAAQRDREAAASGTEPQDTEPEKQGGLLQNLASRLLKGAASRLDRGTTTCLKCRGNGTVACTACKGHGILEKSQVRMKTTGRVSNRCSKCGGSGRCTCTNCKGRGFRGDVFEE